MRSIHEPAGGSLTQVRLSAARHPFAARSRPFAARGYGRPPAARTVVARTDNAVWVATIRALGAPQAGSARAPQRVGRGGDTHLWAEPGTPGGDRWAECADILHAALPAPPRQAGPAAQALLARYPGSLLASVGLLRDGGCLVRARAGWSLLARPVPGTPVTRGQRLCLVSFLHGWLAAGRPVAALRTLSLGGRSEPGQRRPGPARPGAGRTEVTLAYRPG